MQKGPREASLDFGSGFRLSGRWKGPPILKSLLTAAFALIGPLTYIISLVETWQSGSSVLLKVALSLTVDIFLAMIWPVTWLMWLGHLLIFEGGPLRSVLGL